MNFDIKKHTINFAKSVFDRDTSLSVLIHWEQGLIELYFDNKWD